MSDEVIIIGEGDVVRLNSGGPKMTVERTWLSGGVNYAHAQWFHGDDLLEANFPFDSLVKVASGN